MTDDTLRAKLPLQDSRSHSPSYYPPREISLLSHDVFSPLDGEMRRGKNLKMGEGDGDDFIKFEKRGHA